MRPADSCKHSAFGACRTAPAKGKPPCSELVPHLFFDLARGYVWGPQHDKAGQPATWTRSTKQGAIA